MHSVNPSRSRLLIVEGTSGVGKSTLIDGLLRRHVARCPPRKLRTLLHLTQAHTYGPLARGEDRGTLTAEENVRHLERIVSMLEWQVHAVVTESRVKFFGVLDTLHLTHCHRPGVVRWEDVKAIDDRLARIGARMVFCQASAESIWERGILPRIDDEFIRGYARPRFGASLEEIHGYFVEEQRRMRRLLDETRIPYLTLDADADAEENLERALVHWLDRTDDVGYPRRVETRR